MRFPPEWEMAIREDPGCQAADQFRRAFAPKLDIVYSWVLANAKSQYAADTASLKELDDKANATATAVGAVAALVVGAAVAVAPANASPWPLLAGLLPLGFAAGAVWYAARARRTANVPAPAGVAKCVAAAERDLECKEFSQIGGWALTVALMAATIDNKSRLIDWSIWCWRIAIVALSAPLLTAVGVRLWLPG